MRQMRRFAEDDTLRAVNLVWIVADARIPIDLARFQQLHRHRKMCPPAEARFDLAVIAPKAEAHAFALVPAHPAGSVHPNFDGSVMHVNEHALSSA